MASISKHLNSLTPKQARYVKARVSGLSKKDAAIKAGYSPRSARNHTTAIESSPDVRAVFTDLIRRAVPPSKLADVIAQGLEAKTVEWGKLEGQFVDSREHVNWSERRQYAAMAAEYAGYIMHDQGPATVIGISFTPPQNQTSLKVALPAVELASEPPCQVTSSGDKSS